MNKLWQYKNHLILLIALIVVFSLCLWHMSQSFDRLSRYPYKDETIRQKINARMNDEEIDYLIEYSIEPSYFRDYIDCAGFNIYHVDIYRSVSYRATNLMPEEVVSFSEKMLQNGVDMKEVLKKLYHHSSHELNYYYLMKDPYLQNKDLVEEPEKITASVDKEHSFGIYEPYDLYSFQAFGRKNVLRKAAALALQEAEGEFSTLRLAESYCSYQQQKERYEAKESMILPGQSDFQTGLMIRWDEKNEENILSEFAQKAVDYGYVKTEESSLLTWRYVGKELALSLQENHKSFHDYQNEVKQ